MKIGLINTALDENAPPINLVYLATALKADGFEEVKIIDQTYNRRSILDQVQGLDYVGISAMTKHYNKAIGIAKKIKSQIGIPCIVGGVHIAAVPSSLSSYFSLGVIGEGERTICNVFRAIREEGNIPPAKILNEIPGILYWDKDNRIQTASSELIKDLDEISMPDFGLLDERYFQKKWIGWNEKTGRVMHITTSRGCKYNCLFCSTRRFWKTTRFHSEERVFAEINELVNIWDVDHIMIDDDLFLADRGRIERLANLIYESRLCDKVAFSCNARTNLIDVDMCRELKKLNMKLINFGFESGSDKVLKYLKGGSVTVRDHKNAIRLCKEYGIKVYGSVIFGSPTETIDDMKETINFIDFTIENKCSKVWAFIMTPFPATPMWEIAKKRGKVTDNMNWDLLDLENYNTPMLLDPDIDIGEFTSILKIAVATLDKAWMKDKWLKTVILDFRRTWRKFKERPMRAVAMFKNIFLSP